MFDQVLPFCFLEGQEDGRRSWVCELLLVLVGCWLLVVCLCVCLLVCLFVCLSVCVVSCAMLTWVSWLVLLGRRVVVIVVLVLVLVRIRVLDVVKQLVELFPKPKS